MADEVIENGDSTNADEELVLDLEDDSSKQETTPPAEDVETLKQRLADAETKNKRLFARLKKQPKAEPIIKKEEVGETGTRLSRLETAEAKRQFGYENNLSPEETDKVFAVTSKPSKETLDDPFIKAGLVAIRKAKSVADATPSPSSRAPIFNGKSFKDLSEEDRKKAYEQRG